MHCYLQTSLRRDGVRKKKKKKKQTLTLPLPINLLSTLPASYCSCPPALCCPRHFPCSPLLHLPSSLFMYMPACASTLGLLQFNLCYKHLGQGHHITVDQLISLFSVVLLCDLAWAGCYGIPQWHIFPHICLYSHSRRRVGISVREQFERSA